MISKFANNYRRIQLEDGWVTNCLPRTSSFCSDSMHLSCSSSLHFFNRAFSSWMKHSFEQYFFSTSTSFLITSVSWPGVKHEARISRISSSIMRMSSSQEFAVELWLARGGRSDFGFGCSASPNPNSTVCWKSIWWITSPWAQFRTKAPLAAPIRIASSPVSCAGRLVPPRCTWCCPAAPRLRWRLFVVLRSRHLWPETAKSLTVALDSRRTLLETYETFFVNCCHLKKKKTLKELTLLPHQWCRFTFLVVPIRPSRPPDFSLKEHDKDRF